MGFPIEATTDGGAAETDDPPAVTSETGDPEQDESTAGDPPDPPGDGDATEDDGGDTTDGDGTTGEQDACPAFDPPASTPVLKFDVATLHCGMGALECAADADKCLCKNLWDALNVGPPHYIATGSGQHRNEILAAGNAEAVYVNDLNTGWTNGGAARAAAVITAAEENFPCGVPQWFVVNEISAGNWPDNASYRQFVIDFATEMDVTYGKKVIIASPFATPGANAASWDALAEHAWIGAEVYLTGQDINATGNQVTWCRSQYQASKDAYTSKGVPANRLVLFEHFGGTVSGTAWGRAGVSDAGWHNAITTRSIAAHEVGFQGFVSYSWASNWIHEDEPARVAYMQTYAEQALP